MSCAGFPKDIPLAVQLVFLGRRTAHLIERRLAREGYNHTQAAVIMSLARHPGITAQDLARPVWVEPPSITRALQVLERRLLVCREPHPSDGRASLLYLTEAGREAASSIGAMMRRTSAEFESSLSPEEVSALRAAVGKMASLIEQIWGAET